MGFGWVPFNLGNEIARGLNLVFVIAHHASLLEGVGQLMSLVYKSQSAIYLFFGNLIFFVVLFRILMFNKPDVVKQYFENSPNFSSSRWDRWYYAMWTLFCYGLGDNFPDTLTSLNSWEDAFSWVILLFYGFFTANIIFSILTGYFADSFNGFYARMIETLLEKDDNLKFVMLKVLEFPMLAPETVEMCYRTYLESGVDGVKAIEVPNQDGEDLTVQKVENDEYDMTDRDLDTSELTFKQIYESVPYAALTSLIDLAIVFIPVYKLDTFNANTSSNDMYLMSELLNSYVFAEAFMLSVRYREKLSEKLYMTKLLSSITIFVSSNYLQYVHYDLEIEEIHNHTVIFTFWTYGCLLQFLGIHNVLAKLTSRWVTLIRAVRMVVPMLKDLLVIYLIILLVFGQIGMAAWGGAMTTKMMPVYEKETGGALSENWLYLNFNDQLNSINFLFALTFCANYASTIYMGIVCNGTTGWQIFGAIFFFLYFFLGFLLVLNIIVGMVLGFITTYFGIREEEEAEKEHLRIPLWNRMFRIPKRVEEDEQTEEKKLA